MNINPEDEDIKFYKHVGTGITFLAYGPFFFDDNIAFEYFAPGAEVVVAEAFDPGTQFWISFHNCDHHHRLFCGKIGTLPQLQLLKEQLRGDLEFEICISDEFLEVVEKAIEEYPDIDALIKRAAGETPS